MERKGLVAVIAFIMVTFFVLAIYGQDGRHEIDTNKPDLVVEEITYRPAPPSIGVHGGAVISGATEFTIKIKNIGNASLEDEFYIVNTITEQDLETNHFSRGGLVNQGKKPINPGEIFHCKFCSKVDRDIDIIRFKINAGIDTTYGKNEKKKGDIIIEPLPELDYTNNVYELKIARPKVKERFR